MADTHRYRAFISYSQADKPWAKRLHQWLEAYRIPKGLAADGARRLGRIFRDEEDMAGASDIGAKVRDAIENSDTLIVLCSPRSAQSKWVEAEIQHFRRTGRGDRIFAFIIDGAPNSGDPETECFPPSFQMDAPLEAGVMPVEPLGLDVRKDGRERALARLAAGLLNADFDTIWQRERRRQRILVGGLAAAVLVFAGVAGLAVVQTLNATSAAQAEREQRARADAKATEAEDNLALAEARAVAERTARSAEAAALEAEIAQRTRADEATQRARVALRTGLQQLNSVTGLMLSDVSRRRAQDPKSIEILKATENAYWTLRDVGSAREFRDVDMSRTMEMIASTYFNLGMKADSLRAYERFVALNRQVMDENPNDAVWKSAYAASLLRLANEKMANGDAKGHADALRQGATIFRSLCYDLKLQATDGNGNNNSLELRVISCINLANTVHDITSTNAGGKTDVAAVRDALQALELAKRLQPTNEYLSSQGRRIEIKLRQLLNR